MKYYKTKEGWYCLDLKEIIPYGSIILSWYNNFCIDFINEEIVNGTLSLEEIDIILTIDTLVSEVVYGEPKEKSYHLVDKFINDLHEEFLLYFELINNNLELIYDTEKIEDAAFLMLDLQELKKSDGNIKCCPVCSHLFIKPQSQKRKRYCCEKCRIIAKKMIDKERSNTAAGYNQKTINYLRNQLNFSEDDIMKYRDESEKMKKELDEKQYISWLEEKRNYYKSLNKK